MTKLSLLLSNLLPIYEASMTFIDYAPFAYFAILPFQNELETENNIELGIIDPNSEKTNPRFKICLSLPSKFF